jgi:hypothetical protein
MGSVFGWGAGQFFGLVVKCGVGEVRDAQAGSEMWRCNGTLRVSGRGSWFGWFPRESAALVVEGMVEGQGVL